MTTDKKETTSALNRIQKELKAPKGQRNSFGNYNYRSCEDILEALKPLLGSTTLVLNDEVVLIGDRYYIKATATLNDGNTSISASAYARESLDKKGMDTAQITGAASSYARKYALNGLFCIDDTKDSDFSGNHEEAHSPKTAGYAPKIEDHKSAPIAPKPAFTAKTEPKAKEPGPLAASFEAEQASRKLLADLQAGIKTCKEKQNAADYIKMLKDDGSIDKLLPAHKDELRSWTVNYLKGLNK